MSGLGKFFVLGMFLWITGGLAYGLRELQRDGIFRWAGIRSLGKGIAAVTIWIGLYLFLRWYRAVGFLGYLKVYQFYF